MRRNNYESCGFEPLEGIKGSDLVAAPKGKEQSGRWCALPECQVLFIPYPELNAAVQGGGQPANTNDFTKAGNLKIRVHAPLALPEPQLPRLEGTTGIPASF